MRGCGPYVAWSKYAQRSEIGNSSRRLARSSASGASTVTTLLKPRVTQPGAVRRLADEPGGHVAQTGEAGIVGLSSIPARVDLLADDAHLEVGKRDVPREVG